VTASRRQCTRMWAGGGTTDTVSAGPGQVAI